MKTEAKIQQECYLWYHNTYCTIKNEPRHLIFSVPNESRSKQETLRKMAIGMTPGISDLIIVRPNEVIFCEVKTNTGSQSESQKKIQDIVEKMGYKYILIRSLKEFIEKIKC